MDTKREKEILKTAELLIDETGIDLFLKLVGDVCLLKSAYYLRNWLAVCYSKGAKDKELSNSWRSLADSLRKLSKTD